jgi:hypothetical protein
MSNEEQASGVRDANLKCGSMATECESLLRKLKAGSRKASTGL